MAKALSIPDVVDVIEQMESTHRMNSPFDSVFKLYGIVRKSRLPETTVWIFQSIRDQIVSGAMTVKEFGYRALVRDGAGGGGGLVDLYLLKSSSPPSGRRGAGLLQHLAQGVNRGAAPPQRLRGGRRSDGWGRRMGIVMP